MLKSEEELKNVQISISNRKTEIENTIQALDNSLKNVFNNVTGETEGGEGVRELLNSAITQLGGFAENAKKEIEEANKGMKFIEDFEETFIVSIFGKVKAGKSYLGNFIMGNSFKKYSKKSQFSRLGNVEVTVYDRGKQSQQSVLSVLDEDGEGFKVGSTETTSTIQWFKIGGLTWFDTPGIGSVTLDNESLAKEYVKNSDLVIFVCNSDAAGTRQEFGEMKSLIEMNKPVLLMVTMSDTYDEDVDDDGNLIQILQPKNDKDRKDVENYMIETIRQNNLQKVLDLSEILTISTKLADDAVKNEDEKLYKASNIDKLFKKLIEITVNDAAKMKLNTPKDRLNKMISSIIGSDDSENSLVRFRKSICNICDNFAAQKKDNQLLTEQIVDEVRTLCRTKVMTAVQEMKVEMRSNGRTITSSEIEQRVTAILKETLYSVCDKELSELIGKVKTSNLRELGNISIKTGNMEILKDKIEYTQQIVERVRRDPKDLFELVGSIFGVKYTEIETSTVTKYKEFEIGDNSSKVTSEILTSLDSAIHSEVEAFVSELIEGYYKPIESIKEKSSAEIDAAIKKLEGLRL